MASNIPQWTKEVLGREMTPYEFMQNPNAQEKVAHAKMLAYFKEAPTVENVVSRWFTGRPYQPANAGLADVNGTTLAKYIGAVKSLMGNQKTFTSLMAAIGHFESGGNYYALGKAVS